MTSSSVLPPPVPTTPSPAPATVARTPVRTAALVAAAGLSAMAVLSPLAVFLALPEGRTGTAGALMAVVAALDVLVALALLPVLRPAGRSLARTAAALRLVYAAGLAGAAGALLVTGEAALFDRVWDLALGVFGLSLLAVGALLWRLAGAPRWLAVLVGLAGAGYLVDAVLAQVVAEPAVELGTVTFVGEVALIVWLLARGGRARAGAVPSAG